MPVAPIIGVLIGILGMAWLMSFLGPEFGLVAFFLLMGAFMLFARVVLWLIGFDGRDIDDVVAEAEDMGRRQSRSKSDNR